ncbi:response regulator transcription factor [Streptomyces sp. ACA25]|uniref:LuxR C-terminal-related transcriptional regulator n=1 Tax=Streptomyces sp. ACA25 TaxID=3022596 RepID=UPI002306E154|nr:response regulator transcription factor [Streptomyces sp. ACA25]MDB1087256.1 response regulator transcription factor [Streptomyces sp. ACA25]
MDRIRVLVVDEHRVFAESLATALTAEPDVEAMAAGSVSATLQLLDRGQSQGEPCHVLLVDADLGALADGSAAGQPAVPPTATLVADARERFPGLRPVILATRDDPRTAARMLSAGACGWVAKDSSLARLVQVLRGVLRNETHVAPGLLTGVLRELHRAGRHRSEQQRLVEVLTPRELEVLRCMLAGLGRKEVAERLYLSPHTVRTHIQNLLGKLGVHSTLAAVALARRAGLQPAEPVRAASGRESQGCSQPP